MKKVYLTISYIFAVLFVIAGFAYFKIKNYYSSSTKKPLYSYRQITDSKHNSAQVIDERRINAIEADEINFSLFEPNGSQIYLVKSKKLSTNSRPEEILLNKETKGKAYQQQEEKTYFFKDAYIERYFEHKSICPKIIAQSKFVTIQQSGFQSILGLYGESQTTCNFYKISSSFLKFASSSKILSSANPSIVYFKESKIYSAKFKYNTTHNYFFTTGKTLLHLNTQDILFGKNLNSKRLNKQNYPIDIYASEGIQIKLLPQSDLTRYQRVSINGGRKIFVKMNDAIFGGILLTANSFEAELKYKSSNGNLIKLIPTLISFKGNVRISSKLFSLNTSYLNIRYRDDELTANFGGRGGGSFLKINLINYEASDLHQDSAKGNFENLEIRNIKSGTVKYKTQNKKGLLSLRGSNKESLPKNSLLSTVLTNSKDAQNISITSLVSEIGFSTQALTKESSSPYVQLTKMISSGYLLARIDKIELTADELQYDINNDVIQFLSKNTSISKKEKFAKIHWQDLLSGEARAIKFDRKNNILNFTHARELFLEKHNLTIKAEHITLDNNNKTFSANNNVSIISLTRQNSGKRMPDIDNRGWKDINYDLQCNELLINNWNEVNNFTCRGNSIFQFSDFYAKAKAIIKVNNRFEFVGEQFAKISKRQERQNNKKISDIKQINANLSPRYPLLNIELLAEKIYLNQSSMNINLVGKKNIELIDSSGNNYYKITSAGPISYNKQDGTIYAITDVIIHSPDLIFMADKAVLLLDSNLQTPNINKIISAKLLGNIRAISRNTSKCRNSHSIMSDKNNECNSNHSPTYFIAKSDYLQLINEYFVMRAFPFVIAKIGGFTLRASTISGKQDLSEIKTQESRIIR